MEWKRSKLIGRRVYIPDDSGKHWGDWGIVVGYDGEYYHVAFAGDQKNTLIFKRSEIRVTRQQK